jgi:hypothetical protein
MGDEGEIATGFWSWQALASNKQTSKENQIL